MATDPNIAEVDRVQAWIKSYNEQIVKNVEKEMRVTLVMFYGAAMRRVPVSAARTNGKRKGKKAGGFHLRSSLFHGLVVKGHQLEGYVSTPVDYSKYTEIPGANSRIDVGTPTTPTTSWPAKSQRATSGIITGGAAGAGVVANQTMPWLSSAWALDVLDDHVARMRKVAG